MPNKLQAYAEQAERTARQITGSHLAWTAFLTTAARLYKYPYNEQLMIYMQRPEATACAEYDFWNEKMGRYVRRGSTGIALIDATGYKPRLKYVFDVSDTGGKENARRVNLWELKDAHTDSVSAMLERNYGVSGKNGLAEQFESVASQLAAEYWRDHSRDILGIVADSYLEEYDDYNIEVAFKNAAAVSITYSLMSRCGMQPEDHFEHEDFFSIFDFNTPRTVAALGTAVSEINEQVLRQIEVTIRNYEREHSAERTAEHGEQPDLHDERRLHDSRPEDRGAGAVHRQVRTDAPEVPEGASPHPLEPDDSGGSPVPAPAGDRGDGEQPSGADDSVFIITMTAGVTVSDVLGNSFQHDGLVFFTQLTQALTVKRRIGLYAQFSHFKAVAGKCLYFYGGRQVEHIKQLSCGYRVGVYCQRKLKIVAYEILFTVIVFRLADSCHGVLCSELSSEKTAQHIKLVRVGNRYKNVCLFRFCFRQRFIGGAAARHSAHVKSRYGLFENFG